jgi:Family of unknown function (DUF5670)
MVSVLLRRVCAGVEKLGRTGREKISERVRVEMTVVLLTEASLCTFDSSQSCAIKPVELLVRYMRRNEIFLPWESMPPTCSHSLVKGAPAMSFANILWAIVVILVILWLLGLFVLKVGSGLIHVLIVVAVIVLLYNVFVGMRRRG